MRTRDRKILKNKLFVIVIKYAKNIIENTIIIYKGL